MPFLLWGRSAQLVENGVHKPGVPRLGGGKYRVGALSPSTIPTPSRQDFHTPERLLAPGRKGREGRGRSGSRRRPGEVRRADPPPAALSQRRPGGVRLPPGSAGGDREVGERR